MVGIVVVSHSQKLAEGVVELASLMAPETPMRTENDRPAANMPRAQTQYSPLMVYRPVDVFIWDMSPPCPPLSVRRALVQG